MPDSLLARNTEAPSALLRAIIPEELTRRVLAFHAEQLTGQLTLVLHWVEGRAQRYEVHEKHGGKLGME